MTDLDRKIAELKGWAPSKERINKAAENGVAVTAFMPLDGWAWSTSDSKALELVDELKARGLYFTLFDLADGTWNAQFDPDDDPIRPDAEGSAPTRPEAICRAYIAARERMAARAPAKP